MKPSVHASEGNFVLGCQAAKLQLSFQGKEDSTRDTSRSGAVKASKMGMNMLEMMGDARWNLDEFGSFM